MRPARAVYMLVATLAALGGTAGGRLIGREFGLSLPYAPEISAVVGGLVLALLSVLILMAYGVGIRKDSTISN